MKKLLIAMLVTSFVMVSTYSQWLPAGATNSDNIYRSGFVGIGAVGSPTLPLLVAHPGLNVTTNGTNYLINGSFRMDNGYTIASGVTDNGYRMGLDISDLIYSSGFLGTLNQQIGLRIQYGSYTGSGVGRINTSIGLYLDGYELGGTTLLDKYGIYQIGANFKNYCEGNVGIGTASP